MTHYRTLYRPAGTAIAAVLAFTATPLLAQVTPPDGAPATAPTIAPPVAVPQIAPPAVPAPTVAAPPVATVQPTPAAAPALTLPDDPAAEAAATAAAERRAARRSVQRANAQAAAQARTAEPRAASATPVPVNDAAPAQAPVVAASPAPAASAPEAASEVVEPAPATATPEETGMSSSTPAIVLGLGSLLLIGGGVAFFMRRRPENDNVNVVADTTMLSPIEAAAIPQPVPVAAPVSAKSEILPTVKRINVPAGATAEEMASQRPSPENPFLTRRKRLSRARFLLAQQNNAADHSDRQQRREEFVEPAQPASQQVYSFSGPGKLSYSLKPKTV